MKHATKFFIAFLLFLIVAVGIQVVPNFWMYLPIKIPAIQGQILSLFKLTTWMCSGICFVLAIVLRIRKV